MGSNGGQAYRGTRQQIDDALLVVLLGDVEGGPSNSVLPTARRRQHAGSPSDRPAAHKAAACRGSADRTPAPARPQLVPRVDVRAKPHELCGRAGVAVESSEHERSPATLQHAQRPRSATISRPQLSPPHTHIVLRVDVRAKPHELGGRGGAALVSSAHERSPTTLQHAQRPRSVGPNLFLSHAMAAESRKATLAKQRSEAQQRKRCPDSATSRESAPIGRELATAIARRACTPVARSSCVHDRAR
jgi:hypothetical protein